MAELFVQPKKRTPWWLWLLLLLIILGVAYYFLKGRDQLNAANSSTSTDSTSTSTLQASQPEWHTANFNAPTAHYTEVTDKDIQVSENSKYAVYSLGENILFNKDESNLQGSADAKLKQIAASLNQRYKDARIGVFGHTDSTGTAGQNKQLAQQRAEEVKNWLVSNGGIASNHISVQALGEAQPIANNGTAAGRQQNRSVQIVAVRDSSAAQ
jgi:outer membrane protein OmpA-like peptidoglycan-associated protein